jgi:hypothetical protein
VRYWSETKGRIVNITQQAQAHFSEDTVVPDASAPTVPEIPARPVGEFEELAARLKTCEELVLRIYNVSDRLGAEPVIRAIREAMARIQKRLQDYRYDLACRGRDAAREAQPRVSRHD